MSFHCSYFQKFIFNYVLDLTLLIKLIVYNLTGKLCQFGVELTYDCNTDNSICPKAVARNYGIKPINCVCQSNPKQIIRFCTCFADCPTPPAKEKKILSL